ncbi:hypothetical protein IAT40_001059 [Kwoniella sp. CBS 6097]
MSLKVDVGKSEQYRADGNASFKKGKWVEAIGHYTNSVLYNPSDPTAYSNRAQAFLKLDKFNDAERDCTTVLSLEKGRGNVKALYRRSLARKGLNNLIGAIQDIEEVLHLEKSNQVAQAEYEELMGLRSREEAKKKKTPRRPLSPPTLPEKSVNTTDNVNQISDKTDSLKLNNASSHKVLPKLKADDDKSAEISQKASTLTNETPGGAVTNGLKPAEEAAPRSFASMRQAREGKKKAFAGSSTGPSPVEPRSTPDPAPLTTEVKATPSTASASASTSSALSDPATAESPKPVSPVHIPLTTSSSDTQQQRIEPLPTLPAHIDTTSTLPGSGLQLLRYLSPASSPASNYAILSRYPPANIPKILNDLLEPDNLGLILLALDHGIQSRSGSDSKPESDQNNAENSGMSLSGVREIIMGLRKTKRWGMNVAMLSRKEREAGLRVWKACGAEEEATFI